MSGVPKSTQTTVSPSSGPSTTVTQSMQDNAQATTTLAVANLHSNSPLSDTDDLSDLPSDSDWDLSDAPESPIWPGSPKTSRTRSPSRRSPSDSDWDLSDAPENPIWPESPKFSPTRSPNRRRRDRPTSEDSQPIQMCTEHDCPVRKAVRRHNQGLYLYRGKHPRTNETLFSDSNPPPHVWESLMKLQARDPNSTVEDDWNVLGFLRYHVENPNTCFMGI